jgi:hypothetical protein
MIRRFFAGAESGGSLMAWNQLLKERKVSPTIGP